MAAWPAIATRCTRKTRCSWRQPSNRRCWACMAGRIRVFRWPACSRCRRRCRKPVAARALMSIPMRHTPSTPIIAPAIARKQPAMAGTSCWSGLPNPASIPEPDRPARQDWRGLQARLQPLPGSPCSLAQAVSRCNKPCRIACPSGHAPKPESALMCPAAFSRTSSQPQACAKCSLRAQLQ